MDKKEKDLKSAIKSRSLSSLKNMLFKKFQKHSFKSSKTNN